MNHTPASVYEIFSNTDEGSIARGKYILVQALPDLWAVQVNGNDVTRLDTLFDANLFDSYEAADVEARRLSDILPLGQRVYALPFAAMFDHEHLKALFFDARLKR